jgi:two-component system chemotaxis sensor kinase CheA
LQKNSITTHVILVSIFLAFTPLFILSWYASYQKTNEIQKLQLHHMELLLKGFIDNAQSTIKHYENIVISIANSPLLTKTTQDPDATLKDAKAFLKIHQKNHEYREIYLIKGTSAVILSSNEKLPPNSNLDTVLLKHTPLNQAIQGALKSKSVYLSQLSYFGPSNSPAAFIAAPILKDKEPIGAVAIELDEGFFFNLIPSNINLGETGELVAGKMRIDNTVVATIPLRHDPQAFQNQRILHEDTTTRGLPEAVRGLSGSGVVVDYLGNEVLSTWGYLPILDWGVQIKIDTKEVRADIWESNQTFYAFMFGIGVMVLIIAFFSTRLITHPIIYLTNSIKRFSEGEHIKVPAGSSREIAHLAQAFNAMEEKINAQFKALKEQAKTIEEYNQTLETQIAQRTKSLQEKHQQVTTLLNNSGQGFLSCGKSLHVKPEYSKECESLLQEDLRGKYLPRILFENKEQQQSFEKTISLYFNAVDPLQKEAFLSLLDSRTHINNKEIKIEYKPLDNDEVMLILTDITQMCELESQLEKERELLSFITMALKDKRQFFDAIDTYKLEIKALKEQIKEDLNQTKLKILYRKVHTYKGVFLQYALPNLPKVLHKIEESLSLALEQKNSKFHFKQEYFDQIQEALQKDLELLSRYLGKDFIDNKDALPITKEQYQKLEGLYKNLEAKFGLDDPLIVQMKNLLESLRLVPLRSLLAAYPQLAYRLALKLEKEIEDFDIDGGDFLVDPHYYGDFAKALIHLFNNAVDHGIESPAEREELGKSPVGKLQCKITQTQDYFYLELKDDGRGLDPDIIRQKAIERGIDIAQDCTDEDLFLLIFEDGFSLKKGVTQISGRGVGLSALRAEVEALGGSLQVSSHLGQGSTFTFKIPFKKRS